MEFSAEQIERMRKYQEQAKDFCVAQHKDRSKQLEKELQAAEKELQRRNGQPGEEREKELRCRVQNLRAVKQEADVLVQQAIPIAFENRQAKLDLLEKWPGQYRQILANLESGAYRTRTFANVMDVGFREVAAGQENDIKLGQETIQDMKQQGLMPPELVNAEIEQYVRDLAGTLARNSDLQVPLRVTLLDSQEVNAFALPGGFLFLERGLLEEAADEAQLAGVIAHEIAHVAARHGHKLMRKATIASIFYEAAQLAALIITGGVVGVGAYYALQYGFFGLGLVLSLDILGVSREFELEADQLGIQYAWHAGYEPSGFIRFVDKMANQEGHVKGASWFRTHPPFYERMVRAQEEILYLSKKESLIFQTRSFEQMKEALREVTAKAEEEEAERPSLLIREKDCPPPELIGYKPGQRIETICNLPSQ
jgi:Zn-dependent protease with chaperone function